MLVIFGFGHKTNEEWTLEDQVSCGRCHNTAPWKLHKITHWFSLFFIPVIPFKTEHWKSCPVCRQGLKLSNDQYTKLLNKAH